MKLPLIHPHTALRNAKSMLFGVGGLQTTVFQAYLACYLFLSKVLLNHCYTHLFTYHLWLLLKYNHRGLGAHSFFMCFSYSIHREHLVAPC